MKLLMISSFFFLFSIIYSSNKLSLVPATGTMLNFNSQNNKKIINKNFVSATGTMFLYTDI